jgi:hypothetical protein
MILKGSQRGGGRDLAVHLMRADENEHVSLNELRGFAASDLKGAFKEAEAVSRGTKCRQYLFSLSLNPPESARVSVKQFESAIDRVERQLGLEGQPRAVVFHEKEGRRHAHCVWSRIDAETMTARQMSFFKRKLLAVSRNLYLEHGWEMPRGIANAVERNPTNFSLAEWQHAKRQGVDPRALKQSAQECWALGGDAKALSSALEQRGLWLAKGDKRTFVILDHDGEVHALPRALNLKTKEVRARLGEGDGFRNVEETRKLIGERLSPAMRRHVQEARAAFGKRSAALFEKKLAMSQRHREERAALDENQKQEWLAETRTRAGRLPKGMRGLWHRLTGQYGQVRAANEAEARASRERQAIERQSLINAQLEERAPLQAAFKELRREQAERLLDLRKDIGRYLRLTGEERGHGLGRRRGHETGLGLKLGR